MKHTFKWLVFLSIFLNFSIGSACKLLSCWEHQRAEVSIDDRTLPSPRTRIPYIVLENHEEEGQRQGRKGKTSERSGSIHTSDTHSTA